MIKLAKLILLIAVLITFFIFTGYIYYQQIYLHLALFALILILNSIRYSFISSAKLLLILLPFTITLFIFGIFFQLIKLQGRSDWLYDSLIKIIYFPTSFMFTRYIISLFSYHDILQLPIKAELKSDIIFLQIFIKKAFSIMPRLEFHLKNHPLMQYRSSFFNKFLLLCAFPLSLYFFLIQEGYEIRKIYFNRLSNMED